MRRSLLLLVTLNACVLTLRGQVFQAAPQPEPTYPGIITTPGGGMCTETFEYDGGNGIGVMISQNCAVGAGLGTTGTGGTFVPPAGTPCVPVNGGTLLVWQFPCITVLATDTRGQPCFCKTTVNVTKSASSSFNHGLLSRSWGRCVGACDDALAGAFWPTWPTVAIAFESETEVTDTEPKEYYNVVLRNGGPSVAANLIFNGTAGYSFIPASLASQLGLSSTQTFDVLAHDPRTILALAFNGLLWNGQTSFPVVQVPELDFGSGVVRSGPALVIDDANSHFFILGGRGTPLSVGLSQVAGGSSDGNDLLLVNAAAPPPTYSIVPFDVTPAVARPNGSVLIAPKVPVEDFTEGWTGASLSTNEGPFGFGPVFGIYPDSITWSLATAPASVGNPWHFVRSPGFYPDVSITWPAGTLPPALPVDLFMAYWTTSGTLKVTSPTRIEVH